MSRVSLKVVSARAAVAATAVAALAACSDSGTVSDPVAPRPAANVQELNSNRHVFHTKEFYAKTNSARPNSTGISYHGGPLIVAPAVTKVVAIYWGAGIYANQASGIGGGTADPTLIGSFLRNLGGSPYFNINTTYYNGSGTRVLNQVGYTGFWTVGSECAAPNAANVSDADMVNLISCGFGAGKITYDPNTVYAIFSGRGVNLGGGFSSTSLQYCAYHTHGTSSQGVVLYAAMPYNQQFPANCTSGLASPNADVAANSEVNTLAHEIEETTTDEMGTAWFDSRGYENADKCAWTWGSTFSANGGTANMTLADGNSYLIQRNWVNAGSGGCALSY